MAKLRRVRQSHNDVGMKARMRFPFRVACACWVDLLGYGAQIVSGSFNPLHAASQNANERLERFHKTVAKHADRYFSSFILNDGGAISRDLSYRTRSVTFDFLCRAWHLYEDLMRVERSQRDPGVRMVLATGFRHHRRRIPQPSPKLTSIFERLDEGKIDQREAIMEAWQSRTTHNGPEELHSNYAFTKAYVAEDSGTGGGLPGPAFYVDTAIFRDWPIDWIQSSNVVAWSDERLRLSVNFAAVTDLRASGHPQGGPLEVRNAIEIAQQLTGRVDFLSALRRGARAKR